MTGHRAFPLHMREILREAANRRIGGSPAVRPWVVDDYRSVNRANWDERVPVHVASREYGIERFVDGSGVPERHCPVRPARGSVTCAGLRGVHLQCHIGTDTISLARLGAYMIGLDFSSASAIAACPRPGRCEPVP